MRTTGHVVGERCCLRISTLSHNTPALNQERRHLLAAVGDMTDPLARGRFYANMEAFEHRAATQHPKIAQQEMANTYREISRILDAPAPVASVSQGFRELAAKQFMLHAAHPETISQGQTANCHTTAMMYRTMTRHPAVLAETMSTTALTGGWTAPDGIHCIVAPNSLQPGVEERNDPPHFDDRSYSTQLIQLALINDATQRDHPPRYYVERHPAPGHVPGRDWDDQWLLENSNNVAGPENGGASVTPSMMWRMLQNQAHDTPTIIVDDDSVRNPQEAHDANLTHVKNKADLERVIRAAKAKGDMPLIIAIDSTQLDPPRTRNGRNHVICITDIHNDGRVDIWNPQRITAQPRQATVTMQVLFNAAASQKPR